MAVDLFKVCKLRRQWSLLGRRKSQYWKANNGIDSPPTPGYSIQLIKSKFLKGEDSKGCDCPGEVFTEPILGDVYHTP